MFPNSDLASWLEAIGLSKHLELFRQHSLDLDIVLDLTEEDLLTLAAPRRSQTLSSRVGSPSHAEADSALARISPRKPRQRSRTKTADNIVLRSCRLDSTRQQP
jgi:hypothetical protein